MLRSFRQFASIIVLMVVAAVVLAACGGGTTAQAAKKPVEVQVTLSEFKIESSLTTFSTGVPYHFVVTNQGSVNHEFAIMPPVTGEVAPEQVQKMALASISGDELPPGATKTLDYTFTQAAPAGKLEFACHLPGHYEAGMHLPIVVQ
jgi:uncharacterized cupredoxin-like copper-binding protein